MFTGIGGFEFAFQLMEQARHTDYAGYVACGGCLVHSAP